MNPPFGMDAVRYCALYGIITGVSRLCEVCLDSVHNFAYDSVQASCYCDKPVSAVPGNPICRKCNKKRERPTKVGDNSVLAAWLIAGVATVISVVYGLRLSAVHLLPQVFVLINLWSFVAFHNAKRANAKEASPGHQKLLDEYRRQRKLYRSETFKEDGTMFPPSVVPIGTRALLATVTVVISLMGYAQLMLFVALILADITFFSCRFIRRVALFDFERHTNTAARFLDTLAGGVKSNLVKSPHAKLRKELAGKIVDPNTTPEQLETYLRILEIINKEKLSACDREKVEKTVREAVDATLLCNCQPTAAAPAKESAEM